MDVRFARHIGKSHTLKLKNENGDEDEFTLQPLNYEQFGILLEIGTKLPKDAEDMDNLDSDTVHSLQDLILNIIKNSYPEEDEKMLKQFVVSNFKELAAAIPKLAPQGLSGAQASSLKNRIKLIREMQDAREPKGKDIQSEEKQV